MLLVLLQECVMREMREPTHTSTNMLALLFPHEGLSGSMSRLQQSSTIAPYVTLRRGLNAESSKATFPVSGLELSRTSLLLHMGREGLPGG